jgi:cytochrome c
MKKILALVFTMSLASCSPVHASEQLVKQKNCTGCHSVDKKIVGPSFKQIAAKYKFLAEDNMHMTILNGSKGQWGSIPMPAHPQVSEKEAKTMIAWIMTLK